MQLSLPLLFFANSVAVYQVACCRGVRGSTDVRISVRIRILYLSQKCEN